MTLAKFSSNLTSRDEQLKQTFPWRAVKTTAGFWCQIFDCSWMNWLSKISIPFLNSAQCLMQNQRIVIGTAKDSVTVKRRYGFCF